MKILYNFIRKNILGFLKSILYLTLIITAISIAKAAEANNFFEYKTLKKIKSNTNKTLSDYNVYQLLLIIRYS